MCLYRSDERIALDYAGFSTLDSVIRAREVFGLDSFLIVSQPFHLQRALFIADAAGIDAIGYGAAPVGGIGGTSVYIREAFARVKAVLDVYVFRRSPRFLGDPETVGY